MGTVRHIFATHWRLIVLLLIIIALFFVIYALRSALWPFALGLVIAYVLMPAVNWIERKLPQPGKWTNFKRISVIILVFVVFLVVVGLLSFYIFTAVSSSFIELLDNTSKYISSAIKQLQDFTQAIRQHLPPEIQQRVDQAIQDAATSLGDTIKNTLLDGLSLIPSTFGFISGLAALPFFLFYILKDWDRVGKGLYLFLPKWASEHARNIITIIEEVVGRYVRAQLVLMITVGFFDLIGLLILGIPFAPALAAFAGLTEIIPVICPWLGGIAGTVIALATVPEKVLWVAGLFALVQFLENSFLVPRIHGAYLMIHPALTVVILVVGTYIAGLWGLVLGVPLVATVIAIYRYFIQAIEIEDITTIPPS